MRRKKYLGVILFVLLFLAIGSRYLLFSFSGKQGDTEFILFDLKEDKIQNYLYRTNSTYLLGAAHVTYEDKPSIAFLSSEWFQLDNEDYHVLVYLNIVSVEKRSKVANILILEDEFEHPADRFLFHGLDFYNSYENQSKNYLITVQYDEEQYMLVSMDFEGNILRKQPFLVQYPEYFHPENVHFIDNQTISVTVGRKFTVGGQSRSQVQQNLLTLDLNGTLLQDQFFPKEIHSVTHLNSNELLLVYPKANSDQLALCKSREDGQIQEYYSINFRESSISIQGFVSPHLVLLSQYTSPLPSFVTNLIFSIALYSGIGLVIIILYQINSFRKQPNSQEYSKYYTGEGKSQGRRK